ncbi:NAD(P)-dependent oxidoreductase [Opitutus sp. ER46]|uniref:NAD(P)-dependent oxidoreductase n=1 Tax=Opitutus sp. ER46 TaxID=2161864 RepID=UPI000D2F6573|nr:NAD(P)-dependent oxidoreductase [Opitutus sp. ER46]PTX96437.1 oxidoreductase [Opitutus sp. ER46]
MPPSIAFIGTGVMGRSMAGHLLKAGHTLHVYNRTKAKAESLLAAGAHWHDSAGDAAAQADVVITMVGYPADVEQTYLGADGVIARARAGALLIDMTTSSPVLARRIAEAAAQRGLGALDAPVSGGDVGAREARLVIMAGGAESDFARARPIFELMGKSIARHGGPGAGQHCKMANQIAVAVGMVAWCEALAYARRAGLDPAGVQAAIAGGAAGSWAMTNLAPRALAGNFGPGFYVKHILKDLGIALDSAAAMKLDLPGLALARRLYDQVASQGWTEEGTQVLYRLYVSL